MPPSLESMTVEQLRKAAKKEGLTGYSSMRKAALVNLLDTRRIAVAIHEGMREMPGEVARRFGKLKANAMKQNPVDKQYVNLLANIERAALKRT